MNGVPNNVEHIAIIPDGNRRWANARLLTSYNGHSAGIATFKKILPHLMEKCNIPYVTAYTLSTYNHENRPHAELAYLVHLISETIRVLDKELEERGIALRILGDVTIIPSGVISKPRPINDKCLTLLLNYSGREEVRNAVRENQGSWERNLPSNYLPDVDLVVRTGGCMRTSDFMWKAAYSEWYFTDTLFPDLDTKELDGILAVYNRRKRRRGE